MEPILYIKILIIIFLRLYIIAIETIFWNIWNYITFIGHGWLKKPKMKQNIYYVCINVLISYKLS